jgi:hypothetical protein
MVESPVAFIQEMSSGNRMLYSLYLGPTDIVDNNMEIENILGSDIGWF